MTKGDPIAAVLNPDEALRNGLLPSPCIYLFGKIVRSRHPGTYQPATIDIDITTDSDIRSAAGRKMLGDVLAVLPKTDGFADVFGIQTTFRSHVKTEQEEPLLLLSDHIAGVFLHADRDARLVEPVVSPATATAAVEDLLGQCPYVYYNEADFAGVYPFRIDGGQISRQRPSTRRLNMPQGLLPRKPRRPAPAWARGVP